MPRPRARSPSAGWSPRAAIGRRFFLIAVWLLIRMALNALDGMLAREFGQKSRLGAYLNELGDVVSDAALYAPFALIAPFGPLGVGSVIVLAAISEFAGALGPMVGASRHYDGPMGKSDRALVFGALAVWIGVGGALPDWLGLLMPLLAGLLVLTAVNRVRGGLAELAEAAAPASPQPAVVLPLRPVEEGLFETHDNARAVLPLLAGNLRAAEGRDRAVPSRPRAWRPHGASGRRARPARIRLLRLGRARPRPLAGASAATARASAPRCATCRASSSTSRELTASRPRGHRRHRAKRRRGAGRDLGARLCARHPRAWCSPRRPSRSSSTCPSPAPASALRYSGSGQFLRQLLRQGEVPDARSGAHRAPTMPIR